MSDWPKSPGNVEAALERSGRAIRRLEEENAELRAEVERMKVPIDRGEEHTAHLAKEQGTNMWKTWCGQKGPDDVVRFQHKVATCRRCLALYAEEVESLRTRRACRLDKGDVQCPYVMRYTSSYVRCGLVADHEGPHVRHLEAEVTEGWERMTPEEQKNSEEAARRGQ